jgi:hypothetical protein
MLDTPTAIESLAGFVVALILCPRELHDEHHSGTDGVRRTDEPMTGQMFLAYVEQCHVPTLKRNDIVVIDNLRAHKVVGVREAIVLNA